MKKQELLKIINEELIEKLYGFCYARTNDGYEAQDLCSEIILELVKVSNSEGDIKELFPFVWKVARNVYAKFSEKRKRHAEAFYDGDSEEILPLIAAEEDEDDDSSELLSAVYRRISFLTKAYREVMIMFYIDGVSTAEIAKKQGTSETAVRQRLFSARNKIRNEVEEMNEIKNKPVTLSNLEFEIWGTGSPGWGDPRSVCTRQFSYHIVWLCRKKAMSASEIAAELNVPTVYVEEELEILTRGVNGKYGWLRKLDNGKYIINVILLEKGVIEKAHEIYKEQIPAVSKVITEFIEKNEKDYLAFPYLNKKVDLNLILWQNIQGMANILNFKVEEVLEKKYFPELKKPDRPFSLFCNENTGISYGGGCDGISAENICGYSRVKLTNIYDSNIQKHFSCGHNISTDPQLQLAINAIDGIDINDLSDLEKEHAAKAVECGYLYKDGETLYTKILVTDSENEKKLFDISKRMAKEYLNKEAEKVAEKMAKLIKDNVPEHLMNEWRLANLLAGMPVLNTVIEELIEKGDLTPPENGIGAEGCWMIVKK